MKKKNLFCSLLSALLALALLAGCAAPANNDPAPADPEPEVTQPEEQTPAEPEEPAAPAVTNSDSYTDLVFAEIESGPIVGFNYKGVNTFRGIPYATAKRFQAPEKPEPWTDVRPCFNWGMVSYGNANSPTTPKSTEFLTPSDNNVAAGDDCQNLNIWSPSMNAEDKLPVLFFLHGGDGNAQELVYYDGTNLASSGNMVFITANHRESLIGALDLSAYGEQYKYSAFCEYLDIIAALEWVRDNIANFGGDPENVTIMGQSAGGWNVQYLMGMPAANGLYHKAVMNSPSRIIQDPITITHEDTQAEGKLVADALGLTEETIDEIGEIPYETLRLAASSVDLGWGGDQPVDGEFFLGMGFTVDGEIEASRSIPLMISNTYAETTDNFAGQIWGYGYDEMHRPDVSEEKVHELLTERYGDNTDKVIEMYQNIYPGRDLFYALYIDTTRRATNNMYDAADIRLANNGAPVYLALYTYCYPIFGGVVPVHTDGDLPFIFNNVDTIPEQIAGDEEMAHKVASEASSALANFCRTGDPNGEGVPSWPAFEGKQGTTMFFDRTSEARSGYADRDLLAFMRESRVQQ